MSHEQDSKKDLNPPGDEQKRGLSRRNFLKASAVSAIGAGMLAVPNISRAEEAALKAEQGHEVAATSDQVAENNAVSGSPAGLQAGTSRPNYATQVDTWVYPWEWVQHDWPGQELHLNAVEHAAPVAVFGNINAAQDANVGQELFSYNGISPGPTIRVRGDDVLHLKLRNMLGPNDGILNIPASLSPDKQTINYGQRHDYCRPIHSNHKHQIRTTNIHTHGLHVAPYLNPTGKNSDNIFLRIVPQEDSDLRQQTMKEVVFKDAEGNIIRTEIIQDPECWPLKGSEVLGEAVYEYRLGSSSAPGYLGTPIKVPVHPPGTHWYHPHPHGATFTQVASGMAGLLIVEGDVDDMLKEQLDPMNEGITYRERPFVIQRIFGPTAVDIEAGFEKDGQKKSKPTAAFPAVNGQSSTAVENYIVVQPNVIERWRVLNAAVDGQGYIEFFVLDNDDDLKIDIAADDSFTITWKGGPPIKSTDTNLDAELATLYKSIDESGNYYPKLRHLASDGITLVTDTANPEYTSRKVTKSLMMAPANRADCLFQAPGLDELTETDEGNDIKYKRLSVWGRQPGSASDHKIPSIPIQKIATIIVRPLTQTVVDPSTSSGKKIIPIDPPAAIVDLGADDPGLKFPPVPEYLLPIGDDEVTIKSDDPDAGDNNGKVRKRRVIYSGWGGSYPDGTEATRGNALNLYAGKPSTVPGDISGALGGQAGQESMMIDCRKFNDDPETLLDIRHHMLLNTAEEWTVSNFTMSLFNSQNNKPSNSMQQYFDDNQLSQNQQDELAKILTNLQGPPEFISKQLAAIEEILGEAVDPRDIFFYCQEKDDQGQPTGNPCEYKLPYVSEADKNVVTTRGVDHPFHIHINPFWVTGIYDWAGNKLNWNYEIDTNDEFYPRWQDVIRLPRNGGYVKFRSRFWDYIGEYVNHCHILQHEDNGMMQGIAVVPLPEQADYIPLDKETEFATATFEDIYTIDWGIADLVPDKDGHWVLATAEADRKEQKACDDILDRLNNNLRKF